MARLRQLGIEFQGVTSEERVNYYFSTTSDHLDGAMTFMRDAIVSPLFRGGVRPRKSGRDGRAGPERGLPSLSSRSPGRRPRLVEVSDAEERHRSLPPLGVCTATVYKLCARHQLAHIRILNSVRVSEQDRDAFILAKRAGR